LDLELGKFLAMADAAAVSDLGFVFKNPQFAAASLLQNFGCDFGAADKRTADFRFFIRNEQDFIKYNLIAVYSELFYADFIFGGNQVLFSASFDDSKHR